MTINATGVLPHVCLHRVLLHASKEDAGYEGSRAADAARQDGARQAHQDVPTLRRCLQFRWLAPIKGLHPLVAKPAPSVRYLHAGEYVCACVCMYTHTNTHTCMHASTNTRARAHALFVCIMRARACVSISIHVCTYLHRVLNT